MELRSKLKTCRIERNTIVLYFASTTSANKIKVFCNIQFNFKGFRNYIFVIFDDLCIVNYSKSFENVYVFC